MQQTQEDPQLARLEARIAELEIKQAFQENTIEELERSIVYQQQENQKFERKLTLLGDYLKSLRQDPIKPLNEETPPPHY